MMEGNPYKVNVQKYRRRFKAKSIGREPVEIVNTRTGEIQSGTQLVGEQKIYDTSDFVKVFLPAELLNLTYSAIRILVYIMSRLRFGGFVIFNYKDCMEMTGYNTRSTVYRALQELQEKDFIRAKRRGEWWVNPNIIYRGQRDVFL